MNIPIPNMDIAEKLAAMEELWASLQGDGEAVEPPAWHTEVLAERQALINRGETTFSSLDEVRVRIQNSRN